MGLQEVEVTVKKLSVKAYKKNQHLIDTLAVLYNSESKLFSHRKAWKPLDFGDMFTNCLRDLKSTDEWVTINVAKGEPVPEPSECVQYHAVVLTGSRYNARDGPSLPWFEPLCALIQSAAAVGSPRIYAGCFGCQIVAYALGGVVSYNPDKRFVLKAETINVVHNFSEHLLSAHPPTAAIRDSTEQAEGVEEGEESSLSTEKIHGCCSYNAQDPCAVMRASVSRAAYNSCPCPCNALTDSDLGGDTIGSNSVYDIQGADDCVDLAAVSHALPIALAVESVRSETETACVSRQESEDCTDGEGEGCTGGAAHTGSKRSTAIKALKIIVSHGDCVETLPPDSTLLGSSSSCTNEMYVSGSYRNIFSCQSHPEFEYDYCIKERIWPSVVTLNKRLNEEEIKTAVESFESHTRDDSEVLLGVIKSFLKLPCTSCVCCQPSCSREEKD